MDNKKDKMKNRLLIELASIKTFWDCIKWVIFGLFAIIYFGIKEEHPYSAILFIAIFVVILFIVNIKKEFQRDREIRKINQ